MRKRSESRRVFGDPWSASGQESPTRGPRFANTLLRRRDCSCERPRMGQKATKTSDSKMWDWRLVIRD